MRTFQYFTIHGRRILFYVLILSLIPVSQLRTGLVLALKAGPMDFNIASIPGSGSLPLSPLNNALASPAMALASPSPGCVSSFSNYDAISIPTDGTATPYGSAISVTGLGQIPNSPSAMQVTINAFSHTFPDDVGIVLVGPSGAALLLQDGAGSEAAVENVTYTLSDAGTTVLPGSGAWTTGTYKPTSYFQHDSFPAPGPLMNYSDPGPTGNGPGFASTFAGTDANGTWKLYVVDFVRGDGGLISGGWTLTLRDTCIPQSTPTPTPTATPTPTPTPSPTPTPTPIPGNCITAPSGLVGWYAGDSNTNDLSSTGNNGTLQGSATFAAGMVGQAFSLNGTNAFVQMPANAAQDPMNAGSLDAWVLFNQTPGAGGHIMEIIGKGGGGTDFDLQADTDDKFRFFVAGGQSVASTTVIQTGVWYHVAGTWDATGLRMYVNGVLENTNGVQNVTRGQSNQPLMIGNQPTFGPRLFNGLIDEADVYDRGLSQSEVQSIFNAGTGGKCKGGTPTPTPTPIPGNCITAPSGLVGWYAGDSNTNDLSSTGNNGTLQGSATFAAGMVGQAFSLNGTNAFVQMPANAAQDPMNAGSLDAWVLFNQTPGAGGHIMEIIGKGGGGTDFDLQADTDDKFRFFVAGGQSVASTTVIQTGVWYHVAGTWDATGLRMYVNGVLENTNGVQNVTRGQSNQPLMIGNQPTFGPRLFNGLIDEADVYDRGLSQSEVQSIFNAGTGGKCKSGPTTCGPTDQGLISWWRGEGGASDSTGSNSGTLRGTVLFTPGQNGQAFSFNANGFVEMADSTTLEPANVSAEAWVRHNGSPGIYKYILSKGSDGRFAASYALYTGSSGDLYFYIYNGGAFFLSPPASASVWDGQWHHIVGTFDGARVRLYVDGLQVGSGNVAQTNIKYGLPSTETFNIGNYGGDTSSFFPFVGDIDEVKLFSRALSPSEIRGNFGNCNPSPTPTPTPNTPVGNNVITQTSSGDARAIFTQVLDAGVTEFTPIDPPSSAGTPPLNYIILDSEPAYEIVTTASYGPPITVCFTVNSVNDAETFSRVRILHGENGQLVDRTILAPDSPAPDFATRTVCAKVNSLSPFVTALAPVITPSPTPKTERNISFSASNYDVEEACTTVTITVNRAGDISTAASIDYSTSDGTASERKDYTTALGHLQFGAGETSKTFTVLINEDSNVEGNETFNVNLINPSGGVVGSAATVTIIDDASEPATNVIDDERNFVCQQYHDFLNRQPDQEGWDFWTNEITSCGTNQTCREVKRINVSAAFFLSIEFQNTGYLVERMYKTAFGDATGTSTLNGTHQLPVPLVRFREFLSDSQRIGRGVIVLQPGWEQQLENNKQEFAAEFVRRASFTGAFPSTMTPAAFVDSLNQNAGNVLSPGQRQAAIDFFGGSGDTTSLIARAQALRQVAEDEDLIKAESNNAFVLMEYFGYLRRNPNDPQDTDYTGYDFWLTKLNQFNGNFINAEMVKAFISSSEYRQRFGP